MNDVISTYIVPTHVHVLW